MARKRRHSRLARKEGKRLMRQTFFLLVLTLVVLYSLFRWGIPAIIKMAVFLGDLRSSSTPLSQVDNISPPPPQLNPVNSATSSARLNIKGFGEPETIISLFRSNSLLKETTSDQNGNFSFLSVNLKDGENTFYSTAKNEAGNKSKQSNRITITYDKSSPDLEITSPKDKDTIYGETKRTITITGITEPNISIRVNSRLAFVDANGNFSTSLQLNEGDNTIKVTATDKANNQTTKEIKVKYSP